MPSQTNPRFTSQLKSVSKALAIFVFVVGVLALAGWQFDTSLLKRILPSLPVIAPNTAALFVASGLALFLLSLKSLSQKAKTIVYFFSILATIVGLLTVIEYFFGLNLNLDNFLFAGKAQEGVIRMSPQSALNFFAVGLSLFFLCSQNKRRIIWGQTIILIAGIISLISLFGFIYNISSWYTISPYKGMAAHTAVAFVMVFASILALRPKIGFMKIFFGKGLSGLAARRLFSALVFILAVEIMVMFGRRVGLYGYEFESLIHLLVITGVFLLLIFYVFRSLDQLAEAERDVERIKVIDQAKTEFVSLASHQLRTPLTSVSWYTEMLLSGDAGALNAKQKEYLSEIYAGNRRMVDLVDDILNTSRIDMGTLNVEPKTVSLKETSESVLKELEPLNENKKIKITKEYGGKIPKIKADPELVRIVFQNLLSNSLKYTPAGGQIIIGIKKINSHVLIKISDNGYGIPESQRGQIFTKLFRADNIRSKDTDGTGLGLYIVRAIVRISGGKIWFESVENEGTSFFVSLPIKAHQAKKKAENNRLRFVKTP